MDETRTGLFDTETLTDDQRRGASCTVCEMPVWTGSAVDLGERRDFEGIRIFPRAHPQCVPSGKG